MMIRLFHGISWCVAVVVVMTSRQLSVASFQFPPLLQGRNLDSLFPLTAVANQQHAQQQPPINPTDLSRRRLLQKILVSGSSIAAASSIFPVASVVGAEETEEGFTVYKAPSGLKYLELKVGSGASPQYGQLCSIQYTSYIKLPTSSQKQKYDSSIFLLKHGNGRTIAGLDEGLHSMKVGGTRRLVIPPKLGYVENGLGPIPEYPWDRWKLSRLLDDMVAQRGGNLVIDVTLRSVIDDEADQGYYQDESLSAEEMDALLSRLQQPKQKAAAAVIPPDSEMTI